MKTLFYSMAFISSVAMASPSYVSNDLERYEKTHDCKSCELSHKEINCYPDAKLDGSILNESRFNSLFKSCRNNSMTEVFGYNLRFPSYGNFSNTNFSSANLVNADMVNANFGGANFTNADLRGADMRRSTFAKADFTEANIDGANLEGADLTQATITKAQLAGAASYCGALLPTGIKAEGACN